MSERWVALRAVIAAVNEGDPEARRYYDEWRLAVVKDTVEELAGKGPSSELCGPFPEECDGRLRVNGIGVDCPLADECERRSVRP